MARADRTERIIRQAALAIAVVGFLALPAAAETPAEWVELGTRVHGFFGGFIAAGIRIGLDARERLHAGPREISVVYYSGETAPCPCIVDGVMLAVQASPGQGSVEIAHDKAPQGKLALIVVRHRKTGEAIRYSVPNDWLPKMLAWNKLPPIERYDAAMKAEGLLSIEPAGP